MKKLESLIRGINFKKVVIVYLIAAIIAVVVSASVLGYVFSDKIRFMVDYNALCEQLDENTDAMAMQSSLVDFAKKNNDVVDVLILDAANKIIFSAKDSDVAKAGSLSLESLEHDKQWEGGKKFMSDPANPGVVYRLVKNEWLPISMGTVVKDFDSHEEHDDEYFFSANSAKKIYSLTYVRSEKDSNKTYFIFDISPVANGAIYVKAVAALAMLFFMLYWVLLALYVYADAVRSRLNGIAWGLLTLFTNLFGLIIFKICKQNGKTCFKCKTVQAKGNLYCTECGVKIGASCSKCDNLINEYDKYCSVCGKETGAEK